MVRNRKLIVNAALFVMAGLSAIDVRAGDRVFDVALAQEIWARADIVNYKFTAETWNAFWKQRVRVVVRNGSCVRAESRYKNRAWKQVSCEGQTIPERLGHIRHIYESSPDGVFARFDSRYGYPAWVDFPDVPEGMSDALWGYEIKSFKLLGAESRPNTSLERTRE
jgi:hypothetical protein